MDDISVIDGCIYLGGSRAVSDSEARPLQAFLDALPQTKHVQHGSSTKKTGNTTTGGTRTIEEVEPWTKTLKSRKRQPRKEEKPDFYETSSSEEEDAKEELNDERYAEAFLILEEMKARWISSDQAEMDFKVTLLGGRWTAAHRGVAVDAVRAYATSGQDADTFAKDYNLGAARRFDISRYGMNAAKTLAEEWCRKCQFF